jgi:two-component system, OmpR family, sensor histidine kinase BaeS
MKQLNSLLWKLVFAFLLVAVITAALVAVFIRITSVDRLSQLIVDQQISSLQTSLEIYYTQNGSWGEVAQVWQQINMRSRPTPVGENSNQGQNQGQNGFSQPPDKLPSFFGLVNQQGKVIISNSPDYQVGATVPDSMIKDGTSIKVAGKVVGTLLSPPARPRFNSEENLFIKRTTEALLYAVLGAMLVAFALGIILARTLIRPLQALTQAAQAIARGELEQVVQVKSKDEIGHLAVAFNTMSHAVARSNQLRRQMTADIAHDLRTPLTVIAGYIEAMRDGVLQPTSERLTLIYTEIERLQHMVSDLRFLSQADAGELPLHLQLIAPKTLLEHAVAPFMRHAEMQNVTLLIQADAKLPEIRVDETRMMQVFSNLITNALRYTPPNGTIRLTAHLEKDTVVIQVQDNGAGIPAEDLPLIFNRFYRVDKSRADAGESGLGLAIAKALVEAHKGTLKVDSIVNQYTAFTLDLPC